MDFTGFAARVVPALGVLGLGVVLMQRAVWVSAGYAFAIPVADTRSAGVQAILRRFRQRGAVATGLCALGCLWSPGVYQTAAASLGLQFAMAVLYFGARNAASAYRVEAARPGPKRSVSFGQGAGARSLGIVLGPYLLLAACAVPLVTHFAELPDSIALHYGASGLADRIAPKSWGVVLLPLLLGAALVVFVGAVAAVTRRFSRVPTGSEAKSNAQATSDILLGLQYFIASLFGFLSWLPLFPDARELMLVWALVLGGPGLLAFALWRIVHHQSDVGKGAEAPSAGELAAQDERYWRGGLVYVNPADPAWFVPKKIGVGYTINLAHRRVWIVALLLVVALLAALLAVGSSLAHA